MQKVSRKVIQDHKNSEQIIRAAAFDNHDLSFEISFGNSDKLLGRFIINVYERIGNVSEEEIYNLGLESSDNVRYYSNGD